MVGSRNRAAAVPIKGRRGERPVDAFLARWLRG